MALSINTNISSINAQRNLASAQLSLSKSMARLSSGLRINSAADDAAGLAISENMRGQIRSLGQATRNANDALSLVQTADGSLNETSAILVRMRELATQSATGTVGSSERGYIQSEFNKLSSEIDRIANATEFNGTKLLDGTLSGGQSTDMFFQIGSRNNTANDRIQLIVTNMHSFNIGVNSSNNSAISVSTQASAQQALDTIDAAIASVSKERGNLGATQNRLQSIINSLQVSVENASATESRIRDTDVAAETAIMTRNNILTQAGTAILSQANQAPQAALSLLK